MFGNIVINVSDVKFTPGKLIATKTSKQDLQKYYALYVAYRIKNDIVDTINNQYYKKSGKWTPLSVSYMESKVRKNLSTNTWEATGYLKDSIRVRKRGNGYVVGISTTKKYPGTNTKVLDVAKWMEYGTSKMPARPLFRPITTRYRNNTNKYWDEFITDCLDKNGKVIKSRLKTNVTTKSRR